MLEKTELAFNSFNKFHYLGAANSKHKYTCIWKNQVSADTLNARPTIPSVTNTVASECRINKCYRKPKGHNNYII